MCEYSQYRVPRRRREKGLEKIFEEIIAENFSNLGRETPRHILIKTTKIKDKERILQATRESNKKHTRELP